VNNAKAVNNAKPGGSKPVYNAPVVDTLFLGYVQEMGKVRRILGPFIEDERGYSTHSACYAWQGAYINGRPYVRTHRKSRSVLKMLAHQWGKRGRIYQACGWSDCVNPMHMGSVFYWRHQPRDPETKRFMSGA
jgi:hypothetical protein